MTSREVVQEKIDKLYKNATDLSYKAGLLMGLSMSFFAIGIHSLVLHPWLMAFMGIACATGSIIPMHVSKNTYDKAKSLQHALNTHRD